MNEYIYVRLLDGLPLVVEAVTVPDCEGNYNVYINSALSYEEQLIACNHEITHIMNNHFYDYASVAYNELEAMQEEKTAPELHLRSGQGDSVNSNHYSVSII